MHLLTRLLVIWCTIDTIFILVGVIDYTVNVDRNHCEMTYMYEQMQYIGVALPDETRRAFPRYQTSLYGEGVYGNRLRAELQAGKLTGKPVIFIPGSGGSHKQVRSLGSFTLRYGAHVGSPHTFNFFAVDFDDDWSGIYGPLIRFQVDYTNAALRHISSLYPYGTEVIVYGHSMGGIIARLIKPPAGLKIEVILTYATPHHNPVLSLDAELVAAYRNYSVSPNIVMASIAGGTRDTLVPSRHIVNTADDSMITANTMLMADVWASTDHQCIVWCRQLVKQSSQLLIKLVDARGVEARRKVVRDALRPVSSDRKVGNVPSGLKRRSIPQDGDFISILTAGVENARVYTVNSAGVSRESVPRRIPPTYSRVGALSMAMADVNELYITRGSQFLLEAYTKSERHSTYNFYPLSVSQLNSVAGGYYRVEIPSLKFPWVALVASLSSTGCSGRSRTLLNGSHLLFTAHSPLDGASTWSARGTTSKLVLRRLIPVDTEAEVAVLELWLEKGCGLYTLDISPGISESASQLIRLHGELMPAVLPVILLALLGYYLSGKGDPSEYPAVAVFKTCRPWLVLLPSLMLMRVSHLETFALVRFYLIGHAWLAAYVTIIDAIIRTVSYFIIARGTLILVVVLQLLSAVMVITTASVIGTILQVISCLSLTLHLAAKSKPHRVSLVLTLILVWLLLLQLPQFLTWLKDQMASMRTDDTDISLRIHHDPWRLSSFLTALALIPLSLSTAAELSPLRVTPYVCVLQACVLAYRPSEIYITQWMIVVCLLAGAIEYVFVWWTGPRQLVRSEKND